MRFKIGLQRSTVCMRYMKDIEVFTGAIYRCDSRYPFPTPTSTLLVAQMPKASPIAPPPKVLGNGF